jgi:hypothetical protein
MIVLGPSGVLIGPQAACQRPFALLPLGGDMLMLKQSPAFPNVTRIDQRSPNAFPAAIVAEATVPWAGSRLCQRPSTCGSSSEVRGADSAVGTV